MTDTAPFTQLVLHAQQDASAAHRQLAMTQIAVIAPSAGGVPDAADPAALVQLGSLYPGWGNINAP